MVFDRNQTQFENDYQREIWRIGTQAALLCLPKKHVLVLYHDDGLTAAVPYMKQYTAGNVREELRRFLLAAYCRFYTNHE